MARNTHRQNRIKNPWISVLILLIFAVISVFQNTDILDRLPGYSVTVPGTAAVAGDGALIGGVTDACFGGDGQNSVSEDAAQGTFQLAQK